MTRDDDIETKTKTHAFSHSFGILFPATFLFEENPLLISNRKMMDTTPSMMSSLVIDCRSDTVTKPNKEMRQAMYNSVDEGVGDDVFGDDELVLDLEARLAMMFGKEKAVFCTEWNDG